MKLVTTLVLSSAMKQLDKMRSAAHPKHAVSAIEQGRRWNNQNVRENDQRIQAWIPAVPGMQSDSRALGSSINIVSFQTYMERSAKVCHGVSIQLLDALLVQHVSARLQRNFACQFWPRGRHKRIHAANFALPEIPRFCVLLGRVLQTVKKSV